MTIAGAILLILSAVVVGSAPHWRVLHPFHVLDGFAWACALLAISPLLRFLRPLPLWLTTLYWCALGLIWTDFYLEDLHRAHFRLVLLAIPIAAAATWLLRRSRSFTDDLGIGVTLALVAIWAMMLWRSDNGCTGVSDVYERTLVLSAILLFGFGPLVMSDHD